MNRHGLGSGRCLFECIVPLLAWLCW